MKEVPVFSIEGQPAGSIELPEDAFGSKVRRRLLKDVVVAFESAHRQGSAATKERSAVAGSTKKPWRQKGTGHARAGSRKSPVWRGGGTIFGPRPRSYARGTTRKQRRSALKSALAMKLRDGQIKVVQELSLEEPKTKVIQQLLTKIEVDRGAVLVVSQFEKNLWLSVRNIPRVDVVTAENLDARVIASRQALVIAGDAVDAVRGAGRAEGSKESGEA